MADTKRIAYLDMARGVGMVLVVMGHVEYINLDIRQFITVFHMPLFFLISGILLWEKQEEKADYLSLIKKKLSCMMVPYAIFSILSFFVESMRIIIKGLDEWDIVLHQLLQSFSLQGVSTLWFLPALWMSELLFVGIRKITTHRGTVLITVILILVCSFLNDLEKAYYQLHSGSVGYTLFHDIGSMLIRNLFCVVFLCVGYYWGKEVPTLGKNGKWKFITMSLVVLFSIPLIRMAGCVDLRYMEYTSLPKYLVGAVAGALAVLLCCRVWSGYRLWVLNDIFQYYGRNSLIIMVTHMDFRVLYISILLSAKIQQYLQCKEWFCVWIVILVFAFEIPIIWFINRYFPFLLGKRRKS